MPDTKITALTALTTADPANDMMPIVDVSDTTMAASGTTKRISINNILACSPSATLASATITGNLTVDTNTLFVDAANNRVGIKQASPSHPFQIGTTDLISDSSGNLGVGVTPAGTGGCLQLKSGITFPATQVASSDANTLDDYEEGTWTGTLKGSISDPTVPVTATGRYTKIGREVYVQINFANVSTVGASGEVQISGLPFANNASVVSQGTIVSDQTLTFTGTPYCWVDLSGTTVRHFAFVSNGAAGAATHNAGVARYLYSNLTYTV
jgi:hypothetical protein